MRYIYYRDKNEVKNKILYEFIGHLLFVVFVITGIIISLLHIGFNLSTILVCLGSVGLAIALSLQSAITQIVSSIFILFFNLFTINDIVEINGFRGYVKDFNLFKTTISDLSETIVIVPNNNFLTNTFVYRLQQQQLCVPWLISAQNYFVRISVKCH